MAVKKVELHTFNGEDPEEWITKAESQKHTLKGKILQKK